MSAPADASQTPSANPSADKGLARLSVPSSFRNFIEKGGRFPPEKGEQFRRTRPPKNAYPASPSSDRYHLYVNKSCPWAGRTIIVRHLKGLESVISLTLLTPYMAELGWAFKKADERHIDGVEDDPHYGASHLRELYFKAEPGYEGRSVLQRCPYICRRTELTNMPDLLCPFCGIRKPRQLSITKAQKSSES